MTSGTCNYAALGVVEVMYYTNAVQVVDKMLKAADVTLISWEKKLGGCLVTIIVGGSVSNVQQAIEVVKAIEPIEVAKHVKVAVTIPKPHPQILRLIQVKTESHTIHKKTIQNKNKTNSRRKKDESIRTD